MDQEKTQRTFNNAYISKVSIIQLKNLKTIHI